MSYTPAYVYIFIRTDISIADQLVQVGHACLEAGKAFNYPEHTRMCLLEIKDEEKLLNVIERLTNKGVQLKAFWEPDDRMGWTALATEPVYGAARKVFSKYNLWTSEV